VSRTQQHYHDILIDVLPIVWRGKWTIFSSIVLALVVAFFAYAVMGERYESYTLLRVGQGIKDRSGATPSPFGEGIDLSSRIDSLARIAITDHVIEEGASHVGFDRLLQGRKVTLLSALRRYIADWYPTSALREHLEYLPGLARVAEIASASEGENKDASNNQTLILALRELISARQEGKSDLLRISFRYPDAQLAAQFLTELSYALVATQADLVQVPGADIFFQQQTKRLEHEAERAASDLKNFSVGASIYSVTDQRALLLKRADELSSLLVTTRGQIQERRGQRQALADQLMVLRPVQQSKTVTGIINRLGARDGQDGPISPNLAGNISNVEETPPLLLVKVYQDAVASLMKVNTDLNGSLKLEAMLGAEIERISKELAALSSKESEYDRLKRVLARASAAADHYGTRAMEEQIGLDIAKKTQLSSVRLVQVADKPVAPIFPQKTHFVLLGLIGGIGLGSSIVVLGDMARRRRYQPARLAPHDPDEDATAELRLRSLQARLARVPQAAE